MSENIKNRFGIATILILLMATVSLIYYGWRSLFPAYWSFFIFEWVNKCIGILFLIPYFYALLFLKWPVTALVWCLNLVILIPILVYYRNSPLYWTFNILILSLPFMLEVIMRLRQNRKQAEAQLEKERKQYTAQILRAQESERKHISQELHDGIAQELLILAGEADEEISLLDNYSGKDFVLIIQELRKNTERIRGKIYSLCNDIRRISVDLGPTMLEELGLLPSITWLADRLHAEAGIKTEVIATGSMFRFPSETETGVFRIVQECLNNIRRHSRASEAKINIRYTDDFLTIEIEDNGSGFVIPENYSDLTSVGKLGLMNMHERAHFMNGDLAIKSEVGIGTKIKLTVRPTKSCIK